MTALVLLAAGNSTRFGENKLLYEIDGKKMYLHTLEKLIRISSENPQYIIYVVSQYKEILQESESFGAISVLGKDSKYGMSFSIKSAISAIRDNKESIERAVFFVADQPYLKEQTIRDFLAFSENCGDKTVAVSYAGISRNPVSFNKIYFDELMSLTSDKGGKNVVKNHLDELCLFEVSDQKEISDIDFL